MENNCKNCGKPHYTNWKNVHEDCASPAPGLDFEDVCHGRCSPTNTDKRAIASTDEGKLCVGEMEDGQLEGHKPLAGCPEHLSPTNTHESPAEGKVISPHCEECDSGEYSSGLECECPSSCHYHYEKGYRAAEKIPTKTDESQKEIFVLDNDTIEIGEVAEFSEMSLLIESPWEEEFDEKYPIELFEKGNPIVEVISAPEIQHADVPVKMMDNSRIVRKESREKNVTKTTIKLREVIKSFIRKEKATSYQRGVEEGLLNQRGYIIAAHSVSRNVRCKDDTCWHVEALKVMKNP